MSAVMAAGGERAPTLTAEQLFELQLHEQAIRDALGVGMGPPASDVLIIPANYASDPEVKARAGAWVKSQSAVARYIAGNGLTTDHLWNYWEALPNCVQVAWTVRQRDDFASEPNSTGYAVLKEAGLISD